VNIILSEDRNVSFLAHSACVGVRYVEPKRVSFACYGVASDMDCTYRTVSDSEDQRLPRGKRVEIDISGTEPAAVDDLRYDHSLNYYLAASKLIHEDAADCLLAIVDSDADGFLNEDEDLCLDLPGDYDGCPDDDGDGILEDVDECPAEAGIETYDGCPPPDSDDDGFDDTIDACIDEPAIESANGCPDTDGDRITNDRDQCINEYGYPSNNGCPVTPTPPSSP
jgi:hypothetical protein